MRSFKVYIENGEMPYSAIFKAYHKNEVLETIKNLELDIKVMCIEDITEQG